MRFAYCILLALLVGCQEKNKNEDAKTTEPVRLAATTISENEELLPKLSGSNVKMDNLRVVFVRKLVQEVSKGDGIASWKETTVLDLYELQNAKEGKKLINAISAQRSLDSQTELFGVLRPVSSLGIRGNQSDISDYVIWNADVPTSAEVVSGELGKDVLDRLRLLEEENRHLQEEIKRTRSSSQ